MNNKLPTIDQLKGREGLLLKKIYLPKFLNFIYFILSIFFPVFFIVLMFAPWQQVSVGKGKVIAYNPENRRQKIEAPVSGRIAKWFVQEGQRVKKGDILVKLEDIDPQIITRLRQKRASINLNIDAARQAYTISIKNQDRQRKLVAEGLSSERSFEKAQIETAKLKSQLSKIEAELADIEVKLSRQSSQEVKAEQSGVIMRIIAPQGGVIVKAGDELTELIPEREESAVQLFITGNDLPLVREGRKVRLQFEGWPAVQFTGWPSVAVGTFGGVVKFVDQADDGNGNYRVIVFPDLTDPNPWPSTTFLRQGIKTVGWILLDEVSLGWELWRQLNGFPVTVDDNRSSNDDKSNKV